MDLYMIRAPEQQNFKGPVLCAQAVIGPQDPEGDRRMEPGKGTSEDELDAHPERLNAQPVSGSNTAEQENLCEPTVDRVRWPAYENARV
jgi:hypothetical protein